MATDRGRVRDHNEDFIVCQEPDNVEEEDSRGWVYIVADGVGGADAGEVASEYASGQTLAHYLEATDTHYGRRMVEAMQAANTDLRRLVATRNDGKRMATTMVATVVSDGHAYVANVGDSRAYHWRNKDLTQVTKDQSLVAKLVEEGAITEEEAANHPHRNVILFSIGSETTPQIDLYELSLAIGDKIFLCSDGLTRHVSDEEICTILEKQDLESAADQLIQLANDRGGQDNISVAIINYGTADAEANQAEQTVRVIMPAQPDRTEDVPLNHTFLLPYTLFLAIVETALIMLAWLLLRV